MEHPKIVGPRAAPFQPYDLRSMSGHESSLDRVPLRFLVGTTATGKTSLALRLAPALGAEVVSLDSMNVYRGMDIGTAKPSPEERGEVPHHLIDVVDPAERFDVQRYARAAEEIVGDVDARGRVPLFVGGTGMYLAALLRGLFEGPRSDPEVRADIEARADAEGLEALRDELRGLDPGSAERIHANDRRRIVRALEVHAQTGRTMTELQQQWAGAERERFVRREARAVIVGLELPGDVLDARIRERTELMLDGGWPEEAARVHESGLGPSASQALGYDTALALARGQVTRDDAAATIALRTRQFARRQRTWYRKFDVEWLDPRDDATFDAALAALRGPIA